MDWHRLLCWNPVLDRHGEIQHLYKLKAPFALEFTHRASRSVLALNGDLCNGGAGESFSLYHCLP